ncbi:RIP metalloprotease RseP [Pseudoxanthomonas sangjuensis]|uniref:RIP metalloprotease RseP n=1 Tax=Pseudoxanthomonas sangjuensis TaxID=1503750 RepID=UPI001391D377|nr:RIP metalloprotease RseP [Pseudoxanthomonas sangjuensis]KAF1715703.1 RIP metalloprotease RseP [Pseudoxanthomonas sangjuensis]
MSEIAGSIWWMIVALGVLVTFHEFGHFAVARLFGVRVLRFSVGFGKPLWSRTDRHGTEFAVAAIPLGGYVKMLDEGTLDGSAGDEPVPADQLEQSFNRKPVLQRMAIVAAGPVANLVLCVAFLWAMLVVGKQDWSATLGHVQGIAAQAGFARGDRIVGVGEREVATWGDAALALTTAAIDREDMRVRVEDALGNKRTRVLPLSRLPRDFDQANVAALAGLAWNFEIPAATIGQVNPGPAQGVLEAGDVVTALDGRPVHNWTDFTDAIAALAKRGGDGMIEVDRQGERLAFPIRPAQLTAPDGRRYTGIGVAPKMEQPAYDAVQRLGPLAAVPAAFREAGRMTADSLGMIRRMLTGQASAKNLSGPISIARAANATAKRGAGWFFWFLAAVSLSLAIVNLLPIPVLDGGHLLYYLIELVKGSPLSERSMVAGQYVGLAMLAGLMGLAFYNDIFRSAW